MSAVALARGRMIRLGPMWPESDGTLAFDAASGDYWVLDEVGRFVVERLVGAASRSEAELRDAIAGSAALAHAADSLPAALAGLRAAGLLQSEPFDSD